MSLQPKKISDNLRLKIGDHIFACRAAGYSHHGISVGEVERVKYVIHFTSTGNKGFPFSRCEKGACQICGYTSNEQCGYTPNEQCGYTPNEQCGMVKSCLSCFLSGDLLKVKECNGNSRPSHEVVVTAFKLLRHGFGKYDIFLNNCEDFATFCKTGEGGSSQVEGGSNLVGVLTPFLELPLLVVELVKIIIYRKTKSRQNTSSSF